MHNVTPINLYACPLTQSRPLTISGTVLKESDDVVILGVTLDSKMTFDKEASSLGF